MSTINKKATTSLAGEPGQLLFWLQQAHQALKLDITHAFRLAGENVSTEQFSVLSYLHKQPLATQTDIARATQRERASISRILAGMEQEGWISRSTLDRRTNGVELTKRGSELYHVLVPINNRIGAQTLADCSKRDVDVAIRLLKKLASTRKL